ncbi:MAG: hypothetical protein AAGK09_15150 [Planctomycetota bacterium]
METAIAEPRAKRRPPSRPVRCQTRIEELGDAVVLSRRTGSFGGSAFLVLWLVGWSVGCVFILSAALNGQHFLWLFGIPFWGAWVFVVASLLNTWFGREVVIADAQGLAWARRVIIRVRHRDVPRDEVLAVRSYKESDAEDATAGAGIEVQTVGKPVRFGQGLPADERRYLRYLLRRTLRLKRRKGSVSGEASEGADRGRRRRSQRAGMPIRLTSGSASPRPSDTTMRIEPSLRGVTVISPGAWAGGWLAVLAWLLSLGGVTFFMSFWNGIVSVFLLVLIAPDAVEQDEPLTGWMRLGLGLFLVPFVGIGLGLIAAWLAVLLAPVSSRRWRVEQEELESSWVVAGVPWSRQVSLREAVRLEIDRESEDVKSSWKDRLPGFGADDDASDYKLAFVTEDDRRVVEIAGLTRGEAEWIGGEIVRAVGRLDNG